MSDQDGGGLADAFTGKQGVGDFFAPFFTVRFLTPTSNTLDEYKEGEDFNIGKPSVTTGGGVLFSGGTTTIQFSENDQLSQLRAYASSLEVSVKGRGMSFAKLTLEPPYEDALKIIDERVIQWNSIMVIQWGYLPQTSGGKQDAEVIQSDPHYFWISQPSLTISNTDVTIEIVGTDMFGFASSKKQSWKVRRRSQFRTDLSVLKDIITDTSLTINTTLTVKPKPKPNAGVTLGEFVPGLAAAEESERANAVGVTRIFNEHPIGDEPEILEQNEQDWTYFGLICASNNVSFFTIGDVIFLADMEHVKTRQASYDIVFFQQMKSDKDVPMLSFSSNALATLFHRESKELLGNSADPDTNLITTVTFDPATASDQQSLGQKSASGKDEADGKSTKVDENKSVTGNPPFRTDQTGRLISMPHGQVNREEMIKQQARQAAFPANTDAQATIIGVPTIVPYMIVNVRGVGGTFSGAYIVLETTHRLGTDGYETDLVLIRDTSTADIEIGHGTAVPNPNTPDTDKDPGESVSPLDGTR